MKTVKALKITSVLNSIFCLFCIASTICFAVNRYFDLRVFLILPISWYTAGLLTLSQLYPL